MTVNSQVDRVQYNGVGTSGPFTFAAPVLLNDDGTPQLSILVKNSVTGAISSLNFPADYSVVGIGTQSTDIFTTVPFVSPNVMTILRNVPLTQEADYVPNDPFPAASHEMALDKLTMIEQQQNDQIASSFSLDPTLPVGLKPVYNGVPAAGNTLAFLDSTGALTDGPSVGAISSAAANAAIALAAKTDAVNAAASVTYIWCGTATGTADALILTPTPALNVYVIGQKFRFKVSASGNVTGTPTANVSGLGTLTLRKTNGAAITALAAGDLIPNSIIEVELDGLTTAQVINIRPESQGADIASNATINLNTATGNFVNLSGNANITAITLAVGQQRKVNITTGGQTITASAALILPYSASSMTLALGDVLDVIGTAAGAEVTDINRASSQLILSDIGVPAYIQSLCLAPPVRQCTLFSITDTNGFPSFIPATAASLTLTTQNVSNANPLVVTAANGPFSNIVGVATSNFSWPAIPSNAGKIYLYLIINANGTLTPGITGSPPVYQWGGVPNITGNAFSFNIQQMIGYLGNGTVGLQSNIVFVGECIGGVSTITGGLNYALMRRFKSIPFAVAGLSSRVITHALGMKPEDVWLDAINITTDNGWAVGDILNRISSGWQAGSTGTGIGTDVSDITGVRISQGTTWLNGPVKSTGQMGAVMTAANWNLILNARMLW